MILFSNKGQLQTIYSAQTFVFIKLPQPIIFKTEFHAQLKIVFLDILDGLSLSLSRSIDIPYEYVIFKEVVIAIYIFKADFKI